MRANSNQAKADDGGAAQPEAQRGGARPSQPGPIAGGTAAGTRELRESLVRDSLLVTRVDGMHSHTCEERIINAVTGLPGVREVEVDFASGQASIIFDARRVSAHQVIGAIELVGYRCDDPAQGTGGAKVE